MWREELPTSDLIDHGHWAMYHGAKLRQNWDHAVRQTTLDLVKQAKDGDQEAWTKLIERYHREWMGKYHARLGTTLHRKLGDTVDLVNSALADALRCLSDLRSEAAFFAWVTKIIQRKLCHWRREVRREPDSVEQVPPRAAVESASKAIDDEEIYLRTLDAILDLFPHYPEEMAALSWQQLDGRTVEFISERLGCSRRTVFNRLESGVKLLREALGS